MTAVDGELRPLARDLVEPPEWDCPGISVHPGRALRNRERLNWQDQPRGRYRVVEHTCCCQAVFYELICVGGIYQVHKVIQSDPPEHAYTGGWRNDEARHWWMRILMGSAR
ncbi:hypothetical protein N5079_17665 [Planotetraspora sp. A-T 1434]|uniref:hypothetical protein n=1 Tax=Planotetraspora sp. A-T 1434 TaxID=2979219 RepID=UPI0021C0C360|nr:hypothetical protein [Planotetraspora sp. A-T 1434]MCT9932032.1 hypothetical protein [Planotetraspora sp. A-T 1434]